MMDISIKYVFKETSLNVLRGPYAVGEHAVALMLSLNRHIARSYRNARMGNFSLDGAMIGALSPLASKVHFILKSAAKFHKLIVLCLYFMECE